MSKETLRRAAENDPTLTTLNIARRRHFVIFDEREEDRDAKGGVFDPNIKSDLGKLGGSIANNTTLEKVVIDGEDFPHSTATRSNRISMMTTLATAAAPCSQKHCRITKN